jgi:hypothetical protein
VIIKDEPLLATFRGRRCEWCGKGRSEPHHVFSRGAGRLDVRINLIALCAAFTGGDNCHASVHAGVITRSDLLAEVARREATTPEAIVAEIHRLRQLPKGSVAP